MTKTRARATFCNHYRAMSEHKTCAVDVPYDKFQGMPFDQRPCFRERGETTRCGCDLVEYPTAEEIEAADKEMAKRFENICKARLAIVDSCGGPWKRGMPGVSGRINCPVCSAARSLNFSRSSYNGHIHAKCDSDDCVSWME